jgi:hypothetical protein
MSALLFLAEKRLAGAKEREGEAEQELLTMLEAGAKSKETQQLEERISMIRQDIEDAQNVCAYYRSQGQENLQSDLCRLVFYSTRVPEEEGSDHSNDAVMNNIMRWSGKNQINQITGLLLVTKSAYYGILEGPKPNLDATFHQIMRDKRHRNCSQLSFQKVEERAYSVSLKGHVVEDECLAAVLEQMQAGIVHDRKYTPQLALAAAALGGDVEGIVPELLPDGIILALALDSQGGAMHTGHTYKSAMEHFIEAVRIGQGWVIQNFGEIAAACFPATHATIACSAAKRIQETIPDAVVTLCRGQVVLSSSPTSWAYGSALRAAERLLFLAEDLRRPVLVTDDVYQRCSKAHHRFTTFSHDNVIFHTFLYLNEVRLPAAPEELEVAEYAGFEAVVNEEKNMITYRQLSNREVQMQMAEKAVVRGAATDAKMKDIFRELDKGNVGWVGKAQFRTWLAKDGRFPLMPHDWKRIEGWLSKSNSLGEERISFQEFSVIFLKLEHQ